ncbi:hypothetical protein G2912_23680 [Paraburkholderia aspalathi]|uniref:NurA domain-containing protein n=1 Tax=Paraburkholderia nemoris TaxID=2793076 RepID=A0ABM8S826_9BURK|nr:MULTISPECIES: hypothetical protein [Paraburkholderia]MBK3813362.1 hypothetical protein [Paraburkholderia aspalathi]CAE6793881.1 hypothetical protein R69776_04889 [Paraburkholderia nemoris]
MPYKGETAGKGGHADFVRNPDVQAFLDECDYMRPPSDSEANAMAATFFAAPAGIPSELPRYVVASDASKSDTPINDKLPSTQVGFIKVSQVLIGMDSYAELVDPRSRFVDPFKAAEMHRNADALTFTLPGSNVRFQGAKSVKDGFRRAVFKQLSADRTRGGPNHAALSTVLLDINDGEIRVGHTASRAGQCPSCGAEHEFTFSASVQRKNCPTCDETVFVTDWLRLHEDISDFGNNASAMTRMMNAIEHLLMVALIQQVFIADPRALGRMAFVMDGPLAIFGQPAKLHARIMAFLAKVNARLRDLDQEAILVVGLQKTGDVMDHANLLNRFLPNGVMRILDDDYRYRYIKGSDSPAENFGHETYYGQDFLFKTEKGRIFNFAVPYPFAVKSGDPKKFSSAKAELRNYGSLIARACDLIRHFELDLYESAIVPVALAHRHASISIVPGGKVLDIIAKTGLNKNL